MKIILAQGNPGSQYEHTRHNVGFMSLDAYASVVGAAFVTKPKFYADVAEVSIAGEKVLLVKPTTYYNETGRTARSLIDFYKLNPADDMLVIHDDLALPFGTIRTRGKGSDAGNNGIKSLNAHIGEGYHRIRVGIHNDFVERMGAHDFVLEAFSSDERAALMEINKKVIKLIDDFITGTLLHTTHS